MVNCTVLTVKWRKIIGMRVKFLQHTVNKPRKKSRPPWNISRREKGHTRREMFHAVKKVIVSMKYSMARKKFSPYVNITLLLECCCIIKWRYLQGRISVICFKHWSHHHSKPIQSVAKIRCWRLHRRLLLRFPAKIHATSVCFFCPYRTVLCL